MTDHLVFPVSMQMINDLNASLLNTYYSDIVHEYVNRNQFQNMYIDFKKQNISDLQTLSKS